MDRNQVRLSLLKITVVVLLGSTWVFWSFIMATKPTSRTVSNVDTAGNPFETLVRLPASIPGQLLASPQDNAAAIPKVRMEVLRVPCWDKQKAEIEGTSAKWLRLTGRACQTESVDAKSVTVRNLSNGYVATVFTGADQDFTTDFIPMQAGKNDIQIRIETAPGAQIESHFTLMKR
jgi:hypothetical protein